MGFGTSYFTSIIGPNGSGKSNMMDAISFVLGVRSTQLRSKNIASLIYRGRIDDDGEEESLGTDMPTSAYVVAIYEKDNKEILNLKRSINENGGSTFSVNDTQVTVTQYLKILKDVNILIKAKNFLVFQGDVEKVASQSAADLTTMIETVSGSINLKPQFDELKSAMDNAHDVTALKNSLRRTLKEEIKNLKAKCFESDQFYKKIAKLESLKALKYLSKLDYIERSYEKTQDDLEVEMERLNSFTAALEAKKEEYKDFVQTQSDEHMSIKEYETKIEADESKLKAVKINLIPQESEVAQLSTKVKDFETRIERLISERDEQEEIVESVKSVLSELESDYDAFKEGLQSSADAESSKKKMDEYSSNIELITEYSQLRDEFLASSGELELRSDSLKDERLSLNNEIDALYSGINLYKARIGDLESTKSIHETKKQQVQSQLKATATSIKNYKKELNSLGSLRTSIREKELALNDELKKVLLRLNEINSVQKENKREKRLRETCSTLKKLFPNVRGLLNDICKPKQRKYGIALAAILGKNFDAIIVDTLATATECIEYMKEQRLGVASFIPLDTVKVQPLDSNLRNLNESTRPIIDVITYPSEFERAVQYVCGNSLLCDTIEIATSLRWGRNINTKIVTLDGALIHKSGLMTGGGVDNFNTKWDKSELGLLTERKDELKLKIAELHAKIPDDVKDRVLTEEIMKLEALIPNYEKNLANIERSLRDVNVELDHENKLLDKANTEVVSLKEKISVVNVKLGSLDEELKSSQHKIYHAFCSKYGFESIEDYEVNYSAKFAINARENAKFTKEIQRIRNKLQFETERLEDYEVHIQKLSQDKDKYLQTWRESTEEMKRMDTEANTIQKELTETKEKYNILRTKAQKLLTKATNMETEINSLKNSIKSAKKEISHLEESSESFKSQIKTVLVDAKLENANLPLVSGSLDDIPLVDESKEQDALSQEWNDILDKLEVDYSDLDDSYRVHIEEEARDEDSMDVDNDGEDSETLSRTSILERTAKFIEDKFKAQIERLQDEVKNMNPDLRAREHLEETQEKFKDVEKEFAVAREEERGIVAKFENVREERYEKFMEAFEHVSNNIDDVYKELTKSKVSPLGGSAFLTLEDEEEPYSFGIKYHIMPPLKRFRDMENLSGGEKTIGALALLFAVHSYHPSPFFVLDEVDAALDNANVNRIANYISKNRGPNFQFIVISLKNNLFEKSDSLVGIYRDQDENSSKILTVDLRGYEETA